MCDDCWKGSSICPSGLDTREGELNIKASAIKLPSSHQSSAQQPLAVPSNNQAQLMVSAPQPHVECSNNNDTNNVANPTPTTTSSSQAVLSNNQPTASQPKTTSEVSSVKKRKRVSAKQKAENSSKEINLTISLENIEDIENIFHYFEQKEQEGKPISAEDLTRLENLTHSQQSREVQLEYRDLIDILLFSGLHEFSIKSRLVKLRSLLETRINTGNIHGSKLIVLY